MRDVLGASLSTGARAADIVDEVVKTASVRVSALPVVTAFAGVVFIVRGHGQFSHSIGVPSGFTSRVSVPLSDTAYKTPV